MEVSIGDLKLSAQRGLLGNVFPNLRAVCINSSDNLIQVYFYYGNNISEEERVLCRNVTSQIMADFSNNRQGKLQTEFDTAIVRVHYPKKMPLIGHWVFYRQEDSSQYID